jgi:hypothetical protein
MFTCARFLRLCRRSMQAAMADTRTLFGTQAPCTSLLTVPIPLAQSRIRDCENEASASVLKCAGRPLRQ